MASHSESHAEHAHPSPGLYVKIGVVLFVLTALEVLAYEIGVRPTMPLHGMVEPIVVPILLILSAAKFALVAMFYMHLKQDSALLSHLFVWPLLIAAALIVALVALHEYWIKTTFP